MGPEGALTTFLSLLSAGCIGYSFYHLLTTGNITKILIAGAIGIAVLILLVRQIRKNIKG